MRGVFRVNVGDVSKMCGTSVVQDTRKPCGRSVCGGGNVVLNSTKKNSSKRMSTTVIYLNYFVCLKQVKNN